MAASSPQTQDLEYLYASNANVSNFVSVKLSGNQNYPLWKTQMLCLMETHDMCGIVDEEFDRPQASSMKMMKQYDSLLKGWILGSVSECVLGTIVNLSSPKEVWDKLKSLYELSSANDAQPTMTTQQEEIESESKHAISKDIEAGKDTETMAEENEAKRNLRMAFWEGSWRKIKEILEKDKDALKKPLYRSSKDTLLLHLAVEMGKDDIVEKLLLFIKKEEVKEILEQKNDDGSTPLHVAVGVGNKYAMKLLVEKHKDLLTIPDLQHQDPLLKAFNSVQFDTFAYLWKAAVDNNIAEQLFSSAGPDHEKKGASLLVDAITAKQYSTASKLLKEFPKFAVQNDDVLMAIARTFPSELNYWETLIYPPSLNYRIHKGAWFFHSSIWWRLPWRESMYVSFRISANIRRRGLRSVADFMGSHDHLVLRVPVFTFFWVRGLIRFLIWMVFFPLPLPYLLFWKVVARLGVPPIKHIEKKLKELEEARRVLEFVCNEIHDSGTHHSYYKEPILEAAVTNADKVIREIFYRSRDSIESQNKNGYVIFQLAVIHRSEKVYDLFYIIGEGKNRYRTIKDACNNNMLHLAGRLAPLHVLKRRTGAALQLQRELQWFEELKKFVHPSDITKLNIFGETPPMVFTREHANLVKEGEKWMKTTAESCSISAALITTIVFAAAITVPGGSNQETGIPMFRKDIAFTIFAISDAMSLFTSSSSLMVFLSILTARFAEKDFLVSLPKRLIIGLCTLLISITSMMVAFGTTLYLVFCRERPWMVGPICGFACLPILFFVTL